MHKALSGLEKVPYYFLRSSVKFQGHTAQNIDDLALISAFPDDNSNLNSRMAMHIASKKMEEVSKLFSRLIRQISRLHAPNNRRLWSNLSKNKQLSNPSNSPCLVLIQGKSCLREAFSTDNAYFVIVCRWCFPKMKINTCIFLSHILWAMFWLEESHCGIYAGEEQRETYGTHQFYYLTLTIVDFDNS